jgi:hypothetical protein
MKQLWGPKHENWPACDPRAARAAPPEEYGLGIGENGHLARANGAIGGPYCSLTWPSVFGRRCEPLAGRGGGFGGWSCTTAPTRGAWGASSAPLLPFEWLSKTRGAQAVRHGVGRLCAGCLGYVPCPREGQGEQSRCFSQPGGFFKMCKKKIVAVHVTRL